MKGKDGLYRQQALDRLTSPEQLDDAIITIGSGSLLVLAGLALATASLALWGVFGTVTVPVETAADAATFEQRAPISLLFPELGGMR